MDRFHGTLTLSCREICEYSAHNGGDNSIDFADSAAHSDEQSEPSLFSREVNDLSEFDPFSQHRSFGTVNCCTNDSAQMSSSSSCEDLIDFQAIAEPAANRRTEAPFDQMFREVEDRMHRLFERYAQLKSERKNRLKSAEDCAALKSVSTNNIQLMDHVGGGRALQTEIASNQCSARSEYSTSSYGAFPSPKSHDRHKTGGSVEGSDSVWNEKENVASSTSDHNHLHDLFRTTLRLGREANNERIDDPVHSSAASPQMSRSGISKTLCECGKVCSCCSLTSESSVRPEARDVATSPIAVRSASLPGPEKLNHHFQSISNMQYGEDVARESIDNEAERRFHVSVNDTSLGNDTRAKVRDCTLNDATLSRSANEDDADQWGYAGPLHFPPSPISLQTAFRCHKQLFVQRCQERQMQIRQRHPKRETSDTRSDAQESSCSEAPIRKVNRGRACKTRVSNTKPHQRLQQTFPYQAKPLWTSSNTISLKIAKEETERRYNAIVKRSKPQQHPENRKREVQSRRVRQMVYAKTIRNRNFYLYGQKECRCTCGMFARS